MPLGNPKLPCTYKHIVVVHGIGDQLPNETALGFMNQLIRALPQGNGYSVEVDNLIDSVDDVRSEPKPGAPDRSFRPSYVVYVDEQAGQNFIVGFSEVYWQHITNRYLGHFEGGPPIPIYTWAHSINTRFLRHGTGFHVAKEAIDNLERMLLLMRKLAIILKKADRFVKILDRFLGDVEMYAESDDIRGDINQRFASVLSRVPAFAQQNMEKFGLERFPSTEPEIYVVAHSEGTVVAYNSLVEAAQRGDPWFRMVRGLVTLGSPIDKHYTIWHNRFRSNTYRGPDPEQRIPWRNYWDQSDPVGYGLHVLADTDSDARRLFDVRYDQGFARYVIPGLAHVNYWDDEDIYGQIVHEVMGLAGADRGPAVASRWWSWLQTPIERGLYLAVRVLTLAAILFFLHKLLAPIGAAPFISVFEATPTNWPYLNYAIWLLVPLAAGELLWWIFTKVRGVFASIVLWARGLLLAAWVAVAIPIALGVRLPGDGPGELKDFIGYAIGFVIAILAWKLHTTVHRGLVQMWRYTKGAETAWPAAEIHAAPKPRDSNARGANA